MSNNSNFTKLGFSKSGFGCCGHFEVCNYGKKDCFIENKDPEAKHYCQCFIRNKRKKDQLNEVKKQFSLLDVDVFFEVTN